jgi:hypothetical protein
LIYGNYTLVGHGYLLARIQAAGLPSGFAVKAPFLGLKRQIPVSNIAKNASKGKKMEEFPERAHSRLLSKRQRKLTSPHIRRLA